MTICIAALSDDGATCVVAADRQITAGAMSLEFEHHERKIDKLTGCSFALSSGNALVATEVIDKTRRAIAAIPNPQVHDIAECLRDTYMTVHMERAEQVILRPRGWTLADFKQHGVTQIPLQTYLGIDQQLFNFFLQTEFIIAGLDDSGGHIGWVHYHGMNGAGWLEFHDKIGYQTIGSGASHASILLSLAGQHKGLGLADTIYNVYVAKKNAEVAPGVGTATDLGIVTDKGVEFLGAVTIAKLDELRAKYESHRPDEKELGAIHDSRQPPAK